jgi:thioredoxin 1
MAKDSVIVLTDATFDSEVSRSSLPLVVDFWAPWCGPCRFVGPIVEELAGELEKHVRFGKLNTDENVKTPGAFAIRGIPTLIVFKDGREVGRIVGAYPKDELKKQILAAAGAPEPQATVGAGPRA